MDNKVFTVEEKRNHQHDGWVCSEPSKVPTIFRIKNLASASAARTYIIYIIHHVYHAPLPLVQTQGKGQPAGRLGASEECGEAMNGQGGQWRELHIRRGLCTGTQGQLVQARHG